MPTEKLNLPTITGNLAIDVQKDLNALAQAVDEKAGATNGLATLNQNGKVPGTQLDISAPADATTTTKGIVKLNDSTDSTSVLEAATANAVRKVAEAGATHKAEKASLTMAGHVKAETDEEGNLLLNKNKVGLDKVENKSSKEIRSESTTELRTEVVSSLPASPQVGRIVFHNDTVQSPKFKGFDGGKWV